MKREQENTNRWTRAAIHNLGECCEKPSNGCVGLRPPWRYFESRCRELLRKRLRRSTKQEVPCAERCWFALAAAKQGHATLLHALRGLKQRPGVWGPTPGDLSLMKRLKQAFDPDGIFAPGRCVGGL